MVLCCRCNKTGRCRNCACVKAGSLCQSCLPSRLGQCTNSQPVTVSPSSAAVDQPPTQTPSTMSHPQPVQSPSSSQASPSPPHSQPSLQHTHSPINTHQTHNASPPPSPPSVSWPLPPLQNTDFVWGSKDGKQFLDEVNSAYEQVIHWKPNLFLPPYGASGKKFVQELARLLQAYADSSSLECIAMKGIAVLQQLLLQKPSRNSKAKDHSKHLLRRLDLWFSGDLDALRNEGKCIQERLSSNRSSTKKPTLAVRFAEKMKKGNVQAALNLLSSNSTSGVMNLDDKINLGSDNVERSVRDILVDKHPASTPPSPEILLPGDEQISNPIIFDSLNADLILKAALKTKGAAGLSGLDAFAWCRLCSSFKSTSKDLCSALAAVGRRLCTSLVNPEGLSAFVACRLIPLDKCPGVRPIGISEIPRRIISKAILWILSPDIQDAAGPLQVCAGQVGGCEAAIHAMRLAFNNQDVEGALLIDAENAFNSINRIAALHNISMLCPPFSRVLINSYRNPVRMVVPGDGEIASCEGTTQGDPLAMAMYALAITPLIRELHNRHSEIDQVWYADDASSAGSCSNLKKWWDCITTLGPKYGYYPKNSKSHLVVKSEFEENAKSLFEGTNIHITTGGTRHLGAVLGSKESRDEFVVNKVNTWVEEIRTMADIASTQPHAVYSALVHGGLSRWSFIARTIPDIQNLMQPLEDAIHQLLLPALTGRPPCSKIERDISALPSRLGGLGITKPSNSQSSFNASVTLTTPLVNLITAQSLDGSVSPEDIIEARRSIRNSNRLRDICVAKDLENVLTNDQKRQITLAKEKGASSWLTVMPIEEHGFFLNKGEFRDSLHLRYGWDITNTPQSCVCGSPFSIDHAMTCKRGGFPILRHNEIRDITANLLSQVCHNVATEPPLQPLSGDTFTYRSAIVGAEARLDVKARGFWNPIQDAFFDVRVTISTTHHTEVEQFNNSDYIVHRLNQLRQ